MGCDDPNLSQAAVDPAAEGPRDRTLALPGGRGRAGGRGPQGFVIGSRPVRPLLRSRMDA